MDSMAIKFSHIETMKNAITTYTNAVNDHLTKIRDYELTNESGIYGKNQLAKISSYIDDTANAINSIVMYFEEFKKALDDVQSAYTTKQASINVSAVEQPTEDAEDLININKME